MKRYAIGLVVLVLLAGNVAQAQFGDPATPREGRFDFSVKTQYTPSMDFKGEYGSALALDDDLGWGFGFGYYVTDQLDLGFSFSWRSIPYTATIADAGNPEAVSHYSNWLDTSNMSVSAEYSPLRSRLTPYASGTVGWTALDTNILADSDYACWWDPWYGYICTDYETTYGADAIGWSLGAGLRFEMTPAIFLRIGYEHGWLDLDAFDGTDMFRVDVGLLN
jgi:opacity protein-like surface antigen